MRQDQSTKPEIDTEDETAPHKPFPIVIVVSEKQSKYTQKVHPFTFIHEIDTFKLKKKVWKSWEKITYTTNVTKPALKVEIHSIKMQRMIHTGYEPFDCTICNFSFMSSEVLKSHIRIHTKNLLCP